VLRHIGGGAGLIFKGSGFYSTDYRSENYKAGAKKELASQRPAKTDSKTDSKPGTSTDSTAGKSSPATPAAPAGEKK
jgi:hypothetical protein